MNKTFEVAITTLYDCKKTEYFTVDIDDYNTWLDGEDSNDDNLREYLSQFNPDEIEDDYDEIETIVEADDLLEAMEN